MGFLDRIEAKLASTINGAFARAFKAEVQPVEIGAAIAKAMDDKAAIVSADRAIVPNHFEVELSPADHERLSSYQGLLIEELIAGAEAHIATQRYRPAGRLGVELRRNDDLETGVFRVRSSTSRGAGRAAHRGPRHPGEVVETHYSSEDPRSRVTPNPVFPPEAVAQPGGSAHLAGNAAAAAAAAAAGTAEAGRMGATQQPDTERPGYSEREAQRQSDLAEWGADENADNDGGTGTAGAKGVTPEVEEPGPPVPPEMRPDPANRPWLDIGGDAYPLLGAITVIGRDPRADITLDDGGISRRHLEIRVTHDGPHLVIGARDMGSTNGTFVNGERVTSARLTDGDRLTIGRINFVVHTRRR